MPVIVGIAPTGMDLRVDERFRFSSTSNGCITTPQFSIIGVVVDFLYGVGVEESISIPLPHYHLEVFLLCDVEDGGRMLLLLLLLRIPGLSLFTGLKRPVPRECADGAHLACHEHQGHRYHHGRHRLRRRHRRHHFSLSLLRK